MRGFKEKKFLTVLEAEKPKMKVMANLVPGEGLSLDSFSHGGWGEGVSDLSSLSSRRTNSSLLTSSKPNYLQRPHLLKPSAVI